MRRSVLTISSLAASALFGVTIAAQTPAGQKPATGQPTTAQKPSPAPKTTEVHPGKGGSPHVRTEYSLNDANISIEYGRPLLKGRPEAQLMPPGQPWRTGADEATTLKTDKPLKFGTLALPAGTYTLYTVPGPQWQLIVSKRTGQWGIPYPEGQDLGRVPMTVSKTAAPVEQLTISIEPGTGAHPGGVLKVEWGTASASVPFSVG